MNAVDATTSRAIVEAMGNESTSRPIMAVIGWATERDGEALACAHALGTAAVDAGFRIVTGGLGGVMAAASNGAHHSARYREGDVIAILPGDDKAAANPHADIVIPSAMGKARNVLVVATADVVVGVGGGAGTLSEIAMAWQLGRPVVALTQVPGWSRRMANESLDQRIPGVVLEAVSVPAAVAAAIEALGSGRWRWPGRADAPDGPLV